MPGAQGLETYFSGSSALIVPLSGSGVGEICFAMTVAATDAFGRDVPFALHHAVLHRVVCVDLPPEELGVVALQLLPVLSDDLEVDYRLAHLVSFPRRAWRLVTTTYG